MIRPPTLLTITLNPCIDRNYRVEGFAKAGVYRASALEIVAGGKGVNVARVWRTLGGRAIATGLAGGASGERMRREIAGEGIVDEFVAIAGETRSTIAVTDPQASAEWVVNEAGPEATGEEQSRFLARLPDLVSAADFVAICGSAARGIAPEFYAELIGRVRRAGVFVLVDASGANLAASAAARPHMLKPNRDEAGALGATIEAWEDDAGREAMKVCRAYGIESIVVSAGDLGAVAATASRAWRAEAPQVSSVSTLGSGDSMTAGIVWGLALRPDDYGHALRWGVAAGTANVACQGAGVLSASDVSGMWGRISVIEVA